MAAATQTPRPTGADRPADEAPDLAAVLKLLNGDRRLLGQLIDVFLDDAPRLLRRVGEAVARGDARELRLTAHALRGSVAYFGAAAAAGAAERLERMGRDGELTGAADVYATLTEAVERLRLALGGLDERPREGEERGR